MRQYETMVVINSEMEDEQTAELVAKYTTLITEQGGQEPQVQEMGKRRLAYDIQKHHEGYYVLWQYAAGTDFTRELERTLRLEENVLRYLTVRLGE
ncbi:30S ribosomal protein S6 [Alicyclobacillaceae bacterium I2511]|nr:30S ribosomal protein S6 [Alicyclobacillaceae bacterium I2511]